MRTQSLGHRAVCAWFFQGHCSFQRAPGWSDWHFPLRQSSSPIHFCHVVSFEQTFSLVLNQIGLPVSSICWPSSGQLLILQIGIESIWISPAVSLFLQDALRAHHSSQLVSASSSSVMPFPRWDHHLPHPMACASVNTAKGIESDQLFSAFQEHRCSSQHPLGLGFEGTVPQRQLRCPFQAKNAADPVWLRIGTPFSPFLALSSLTLTHTHLHTLNHPH